MFQLVITALDWFGVAVFAVTGALVASRKQMDIFGFALLATVTGIGGGSVRDLLLGQPVFWVEEPLYVAICVAVSAIVFFTAHIPGRIRRWLRGPKSRKNRRPAPAFRGCSVRTDTRPRSMLPAISRMRMKGS